MACALTLPGCWLTPAEYAAQADAQVFPLLADTQATEVDDRVNWIRQPEPAAADADLDSDEFGATSGLLPLDLPAALATAVTANREYLTRRDSVYLEGLSLTLVQYNFGPIMDATIAGLWADSEVGSGTWGVRPEFSVSKILDTGGQVELRAGAGYFANEAFDNNFESDIDLTWAQPLMRGAGYENSHEALTQAQRDLVYEVRDFELFREDFTIRVAEDFFDLVSQKLRLVNIEESYRQAVFDREKSVALRQVDRVQDEDVFTAQRREVDEENRVLVARNNLKRSLDEFKILLGMPTITKLDIAEGEPPFQSVRLNMASAVAVALHNRLDLKTLEGRVVDARRQQRVAANRLRPDLDLTLGAGSLGADEQFSQSAPDQWAASANLVLGLPLNRQAERNAYRASLIQVEQAERNLSLLRENIERDVRNQLRSLLTAEELIVIQHEQIAEEQRAVAVTQIRYEAGDSDQRDLSDARQSLVDAQNRLIDLLADHFIARLELLKTMGVLFIDDEGMWQS